MENILFFLHAVLLLLFGIILSGAFAGIQLSLLENKKNFFFIYVVCALLQIILYTFLGEDIVRKFYPLSTHLPLILFLCIKYRKRLATSLTSVLTAYLFCQPANWFGILGFTISKSASFEYLVRIIVLVTVAVITLRSIAPYFARIYNKDTRSIYIFGIMPIVYYFFDYIIMVYTKLWINNRIVVEFMPFFFAIIYMIFAILYCSENEEKVLAQHKADLIKITAEQQNKEIESIKRNEKEIRILHHDMRLFLNSLLVCLDQNDLNKAKEMLSSYCSYIENTRIQHFCNIDTLNYLLSDFAAKCKSNHITFTHKIELDELQIDINLFASILLNALDNAFNAQKELDTASRKVNLSLKTVHGKLLLCVKNPIFKEPIFENGLPVSTKEGHGYGTQSICYLTERLNGKFQFTVQENVFTIKIII